MESKSVDDIHSKPLWGISTKCEEPEPKKHTKYFVLQIYTVKSNFTIKYVLQSKVAHCIAV